MATDPFSSDRAQEFLNNFARSYGQAAGWESMEAPGSDSSSVEWELPEPDDLIRAIRESDFKAVENPFEELDRVYSGVKQTNSGGRGGDYNLLRGLESLDPRSSIEERPDCSDRTWYNWIADYKEAGLIDENHTLTDRGKMIIDTSEEAEEAFLGLERKAGDAYRVLSTQKYNSTQANNGGLIKAFLMYPAGFGHTAIYDQEGVSESTARTMANSFEGQLYTDGYSFTERGRTFSQIMLEQMKSL